MPDILKAYERWPNLVWGTEKALKEMLFKLIYAAIVVMRGKEQHGRRLTDKREPTMALKVRAV